MPLIHCPDCGLPVSDQATACIHCGRPLTPREMPKDLAAHPCALVLIQADFNDLTLLPLIQELRGCTEEEAQALRPQTPVILVRGLPYARCLELIGRFGKNNMVHIYRDEDADTLSAAEPLLSSRPAPGRTKLRQPLSFWQTVGAIVTATVLLWLGSFLLSWLMFSLSRF